MNYRHAYHAGNFADCFKHALLIAIIDSFATKPTPYFVLDTHAGAGSYDLEAEPSRRTGEADNGIRRLLCSPLPALDRYLGLVTSLGLYPGSPALIRGILRADDRLACCELHRDDVSALRLRFRRDRQVAVHERSGWEALGALLPPKERRSVVFIDPPFENRDEFITLVAGLRRGYSRARNGTFASWYPIKQLAAVRGFHAGLISSGIRNIVAVELLLRDAKDSERLNGCGLAVINPPYGFEDNARLISRAVLHGLGGGEAGAGTAVVGLVDE